MNRITKIVAGLSLAAAVAVPSVASAQAWQSINARQARLDARIDQGIRSGALNRAEAARLRTDFRALARLERRYRVNGLSLAERRDLDRRFDALSARIRVQKHDRNHRW
ncbi:hypothetical protein [Sphingomonas sp. DT-204]|uniref:hypothetical protein n=1 Tax=Sphingomonas sp. DT-204 TaxID=3396166 RepID=UPI003F1A357C